MPRLDIAPNTGRALPLSRSIVSQIRERSIIIHYGACLKTSRRHLRTTLCCIPCASRTQPVVVPGGRTRVSRQAPCPRNHPKYEVFVLSVRAIEEVDPDLVVLAAAVWANGDAHRCWSLAFQVSLDVEWFGRHGWFLWLRVDAGPARRWCQTTPARTAIGAWHRHAALDSTLGRGRIPETFSLSD